MTHTNVVLCKLNIGQYSKSDSVTPYWNPCQSARALKYPGKSFEAQHHDESNWRARLSVPGMKVPRDLPHRSYSLDATLSSFRDRCQGSKSVAIHIMRLINNGCHIAPWSPPKARAAAGSGSGKLRFPHVVAKLFLPRRMTP